MVGARDVSASQGRAAWEVVAFLAVVRKRGGDEFVDGEFDVDACHFGACADSLWAIEYGQGREAVGLFR
jgi:hypothetical protein